MLTDLYMRLTMRSVGFIRVPKALHWISGADNLFIEPWCLAVGRPVAEMFGDVSLPKS